MTPERIAITFLVAVFSLLTAALTKAFGWVAFVVCIWVFLIGAALTALTIIEIERRR